LHAPQNAPGLISPSPWKEEGKRQRLYIYDQRDFPKTSLISRGHRQKTGARLFLQKPFDLAELLTLLIGKSWQVVNEDPVAPIFE